MTRYGFLVDLNYCISCKACEVACKTWNGVPTDRDVHWRRVVDEVHGTGRSMTSYSVSLACHHCERPACVRSCPTGAMSIRPDGFVAHDAARCIGCRFCESVCPYGAPQYDAYDKLISKCTGCTDRVDEGLKPACVDTCPTEALQFGPLEEIDREGVREIRRFSNPNRTWPAVRFVPREA